MADKDKTLIEDARKSGRAMTGKDFSSSSSKSALSGLLKSDQSRNASAMDLAESERKRHMAQPGAFKQGGMVKKTGMAKVHKGERVLTKSQVKSNKMSGGGSRKLCR